MKRAFILLTSLLLISVAAGTAQAYGVAPGAGAAGMPPPSDWYPPGKTSWIPPIILPDDLPDVVADDVPDTADPAPRAGTTVPSVAPQLPKPRAQ